MVKTNTIKKVVNGEIADADDINQIVENAGSEGGAIPYDEDTQQRATGGSESLGAAQFPWGDFHISEDAHLKEIDPDTDTESASVTFSQLRKFISQKDTPSSYAGHGEKLIRVNTAETALEFIGKAGLSLISTTAISSANSGDITIAADKLYKIIIVLTNSSADEDIGMRIDSDSGASDYSDITQGSGSYITLGEIDLTTSNYFAELTLDTTEGPSNFIVKLIGTSLSHNKANVLTKGSIGGRYGQSGGTPTSFEIVAIGAATLTGTIYLYEYALV